MMENWSNWLPMPNPKDCRVIEAPKGPRVYKIRIKESQQPVLFGIGKECSQRMMSLYPAPYGTGRRNKTLKREYVLQNWNGLEYCIFAT